MQKSTTHALATVLQASSESDALVILGRILDSLPIGFHVSDCGSAFHVLYANHVWERWLRPEKLPVAGKALGDLFPTAEQAGVIEIMRDVCATARPKHLNSFEFRELGEIERGKSGKPSRWDWQIYPLSDPAGHVTHLLNVIMDVSDRPPRKGRLSKEDRQTQNRRRKEASGVLQIFGLTPDSGDHPDRGRLTEREYQVAELLGVGFTNAAIGQRLNITSATVSSHVAHILSKLSFRSRAQVAAWVVGRQLKRPAAGAARDAQAAN